MTPFWFYFCIFKPEQELNMPQVAFSVRMDSDLKQEFDSLCEEFGMSMATAINISPAQWFAKGAFPLRFHLTKRLR